MSDPDEDLDNMTIAEADGPDLQQGDDLQTQLGTPDRASDDESLAEAELDDAVRSVDALGE